MEKLYMKRGPAIVEKAKSWVAQHTTLGGWLNPGWSTYENAEAETIDCRCYFHSINCIITVNSLVIYQIICGGAQGQPVNLWVILINQPTVISKALSVLVIR